MNWSEKVSVLRDIINSSNNMVFFGAQVFRLKAIFRTSEAPADFIPSVQERRVFAGRNAVIHLFHELYRRLLITIKIN